MRMSDWRSDVCSSDLVELVHLVGDVLHLIDDTANLWADAVDRELEGEADRVVGDRFQIGHELRHVDEGKGAGEDVDAAATRPNLRELDIGWIDTLLRETRSEEHTSELQSLMRISYAVFCLNKKTINI